MKSWTPLDVARYGSFVRFWWVNHNQTYRQETQGGYLWSPKRGKSGSRIAFYDFMREVAPGDIVFSFSDTWIRNVGVAIGYCHECPQPPEFGKTGSAWDNIGWKVPVRFFPLEHPIRPRESMGALAPLLPPRYSPIRPDGGGNQVYLTSISEAFAHALAGLIGSEYQELQSVAFKVALERDAYHYDLGSEDTAWEEHIAGEVNADTALTETTRVAVIEARIGQGLFRANVSKLEKRCRITGVSEPRHLRASHTKPWRTSTNSERIDGENGFLLTPSVDHLFDGGFISFEDNGDLLLSPVARIDSLQRMGIESNRRVNVGGFSQGQKHFLAYHRDNIFLSSSLSSRSSENP
jgi:putative restriction endonuclease